MADRTLTDPLEGTLEKAFPTRSLAAKALVRRCGACLNKLGKEQLHQNTERQVCENSRTRTPTSGTQGS